MPQTSPLGLVIGLSGGLASAVLFFSAARGSPALSALLLLLTPLPTLIAAIGWGLRAVIVAAGSCALVMAATISAGSSIGTLISLGIPAAMIAYLVPLSRAVGGDPEVREWYPPGRLLVAIAIYGAALPILLLPLAGGSYEDLREPLGELMRRFSREASTDLGIPALTDAQREFAVTLMVKTLPGFIAGYWTAIFCVNVYLAGRVARASGHLVRDWPDLPGLKLPKDVLVIFGIGMLAMFASGIVSVAGVAVVGSFMFVFFLAGLALMHAIARRRTPALLIATYIALLLAGPYTAAALVLGGITDTAFNLKARFGGERPAT